MDIDPCSPWEDMILEHLDSGERMPGELALHLDRCPSCRKACREFSQLHELMVEMPVCQAPAEISEAVMTGISSHRHETGKTAVMTPFDWLKKHMLAHGLGYACLVLTVTLVYLAGDPAPAACSACAGLLAEKAGIWGDWLLQGALSSASASLQYLADLFRQVSSAVLHSDVLTVPAQCSLSRGWAAVFICIVILLNFHLVKERGDRRYVPSEAVKERK